MAAKSAGLSFDDWHKWSADGSSYENEKSCLTVWKSINEDGGISEKSLFKMAMDKGWYENNTRPSLPLTQHKITDQNAVKTPVNPRVDEVWAHCIPATNINAYIRQKNGFADGLRVYPEDAPKLTIRGQNIAGYLVVPCWSDGKLQTMQFIPPNGGDKLNLADAKFNDGFFQVGEITNRVYICEGIGQAWACNSATGAAAVNCFGAGRMATVAKTLRQQYPNAQLVIVPDHGKEIQATAIASAVTGSWVEMPQDKHSNYDVNDLMQEAGIEALTTLLERTKVQSQPFKLLSGADLCNAPPMRWLVHGVLPVEGLAALYGASGSGKSFLMLDIGCAVAGGECDWFERRVTQAPVTYVCLEGEAGMGKRLQAWRQHHKKLIPDALRFITQPFDLLGADVIDLSKSVIAGGGAGGLVILDTLNRAAPGADENSSVDMGNIIAAAKKLQNLVGGLVLLVHHTGKDATKGLRGHSSLYAALDGAIEVIKTDNRREWSVAKSKDDITGDAHPFKLEIVTTGLDDDGDEITSCVAVPDESINNAMRHTLPPKSGNQKIIWEALGAVLRSSSQHGQGGAPVSRPCVRLDEAVEKTRGRLVCEQKRQSERTQSAISGLVARGLLEHKDGWLWVA
jgi:hypothetical protein